MRANTQSVPNISSNDSTVSSPGVKGSITKSDYELLREKWAERHQQSKEILWSKHADSLKWLKEAVHPKKLLIGSLSSLMMFNLPALSMLSLHPGPDVFAVNAKAPPRLVAEPVPARSVDSLTKELAPSLPIEQQSLSSVQEDGVTKVLSKYFGMDVSAELDGIRLNTNYGYIGAEQHLALYPGDNMESHLSFDDSQSVYSGSGMAPGRGAWGYFASSRSSLTKEDILRERYYIAIPTFMSPGYGANVSKYYNFFKYRKLLVVNPQNGRAIVADIGDAGPSPFTGKQLGGSPEVMSYLQRVDGRQRGTVLYFFIDDNNNAIPLGPINIKQ